MKTLLKNTAEGALPKRLTFELRGAPTMRPEQHP